MSCNAFFFANFVEVITVYIFFAFRFNACSGSLEETREICSALARMVILPYANKKDKDFIKHAFALRDGIACIMPTQAASVAVHYAYYLTKTTSLPYLKNIVADSSVTDNIVQLNSFSKKIDLAFHKIWYKSLKLTVFRVLSNYIVSVALWLQPRFPLMVYLMFGFKSFRFLSFRYHTWVLIYIAVYTMFIFESQQNLTKTRCVWTVSTIYN